jgi:hypothetical protein
MIGNSRGHFNAISPYKNLVFFLEHNIYSLVHSYRKYNNGEIYILKCSLYYFITIFYIILMLLCKNNNIRKVKNYYKII